MDELDRELARIRSEDGGEYEVELIVFHENQPPELGERLAEIVGVPQVGVPLEAFRRQLGGDEGYVTDPDGNQHHVTLEGWSDSDPEKARVALTFQFVPRDRERYTSRVRALLEKPEDM
jgi:hypothetical protein